MNASCNRGANAGDNQIWSIRSKDRGCRAALNVDVQALFAGRSTVVCTAPISVGDVSAFTIPACAYATSADESGVSFMSPQSMYRCRVLIRDPMIRTMVSAGPLVR